MQNIDGGVAKLEKGNGGLTRIAIKTEHAEAHVYEHGAHVTHYQPAGHAPVLMMSNRSFFQTGKPIRGGVPVIFPWFGAREGHPDAPMHGFVRVKAWNVDSVNRGGDHVVLTLSTVSDDATRAQWPHDFRLKHVIRVGPTLEMSLVVENTGRDAFKFEEALHTYFAVDDVWKIGIAGLKGATYLDKNQNFAEVAQVEDPIVINGKSDRVYVNTAATCTITDPIARRRIVVAKEGSNSTVVWCPWMMTPDGMPDLGEGQWQRMVCIETCNVKQNAVTLEAGKTHTMRATIRVERL